MAIISGKSWTVRTVYLYVAALVGLALIISGSVQIFQMALKATVLTQADAEEYMWAKQPPAPYLFDRPEDITDPCGLSDEQLTLLKNWLNDYSRWQQQQADLDVVAARRQRQLAGALGLLFAGIPVYVFHWRTIRKEFGKVDASE